MINKSAILRARIIIKIIIFSSFHKLVKIALAFQDRKKEPNSLLICIIRDYSWDKFT